LLPLPERLEEREDVPLAGRDGDFEDDPDLEVDLVDLAADFDDLDVDLDDFDDEPVEALAESGPFLEPPFLAASRLASRAAMRSTTFDSSSGSSSTTISSPAAFFFRKSSTCTRYVSS
jgi:hypothetical protein